MAIEIIDFKPHHQNTLQGFLVVRLTETGLEIRDIALHQKNDNRWLQLPAKPYKKPGGGKGWSYILNFHEKERYQQFQSVVLDALDAFQCQDKGNEHGTKRNPESKI